MFYREDLNLQLRDLNDRANANSGVVLEVPSGDISFRLSQDTPAIIAGTKAYPANERALQSFSDWLKVPSPFARRIRREVGPDLEQEILSALLQRTSTSVAAIEVDADDNIVSVRDPGKQAIPLSRIVNIASRVLGTDEAPVQRVVDEPGEFSFDVHVPFNSDKNVGGDRDTVINVPDTLQAYSYFPEGVSRVNDLTAAGLRFGYDRKRNLAPWVQPWSFRLECTNGMETEDEGLRVDARGSSVDDVLSELEAAAERAFSRVELQIEHFYRLRDRPVDNPERFIHRIGRERGIPDRSIQALIALAPTDALPDSPTEFDLVNMITNLANSDQMPREGGRRILEQAGGSVVADHQARCAHCHAAQA